MQEHPHKTQSNLDLYGDSGIASRHEHIPQWLLLSYILIPLWGLLCFALFWNGSRENAWFSHSNWPQLQKAANTTFPPPISSDNDER